MKNNKTLTTIEIKKNKVKINAYRILNKQIISIFEHEIEAKPNTSFLSDNGVVKQSSAVELKRELANILKTIRKNESGFDENQIFMVVPSATYSYATKKIQIPTSENPILANKELIQDYLKKFTKKEQLENSAYHLEVEMLQVKIDGVKQEDENFLVGGKDIEIIASVKSIYKKVYESHKMVVEKTGENIVKYLTNLEALFNSIERAGKEENDIVVVDWKEDKVEAGLFKNGAFVEYASIPHGMNYIIEKLSNEFNLSTEMSQNYLYNNINFESENILKSVFLKFSNSLGSKALTGEQIQTIVKKAVKNSYKEIKEEFVTKNKIDFYVTPVFNFGLIQEIPNGLSLLTSNKSSSDYFNKTKIIGALKNAEHFESYGLISKFVNRVITADIKNIQRNIQNKPVNYQFSFSDDVIGQNKASSHLYLKNDGILIDKVEA
ncbi:hypothetical protein [Mesoplasma melaleucae]|uniref:Uncharacterized protein n=1 Tax=Mesoplasma melaleucae TaxID=81459 RepID=A0A2K8NY21_9MOLU|nr:hypothetical protein [Mesoplasma melaleucae]ATZ18078.1 hypothetical protein EMELA_v1c05430 [Mesoplasma melaleucae]